MARMKHKVNKPRNAFRSRSTGKKGKKSLGGFCECHSVILVFLHIIRKTNPYIAVSLFEIQLWSKKIRRNKGKRKGGCASLLVARPS
jgi:hypothetical protein